MRKLDQIDFNDMIHCAADYVENGKYRSPYKYILIDEFQDISPARARLIKALVRQSPDNRLFAVGDDWQAISRYAGSDISIIRDFGNHFGDHEQLRLETTFRCPDRLAALATEFILKNPSQIPKTVRSTRTADDPCVHIGLAANPGVPLVVEALDRIHEHARTVEGEATVLVIARYNHLLQHIKPLQKRHPALRVAFKSVHASKGLEADYVILLGLNAGKYAFPTEIVDDPLLDLVLATPETHAHAEERRLFYVALTRARRRIYLVCDGPQPSSFATELVHGDYDVTLFGRPPRPTSPAPPAPAASSSPASAPAPTRPSTPAPTTRTASTPSPHARNAGPAFPPGPTRACTAPTAGTNSRPVRSVRAGSANAPAPSNPSSAASTTRSANIPSLSTAQRNPRPRPPPRHPAPRARRKRIRYTPDRPGSTQIRRAASPTAPDRGSPLSGTRRAPAAAPRFHASQTALRPRPTAATAQNRRSSRFPGGGQMVEGHLLQPPRQKARSRHRRRGRRLESARHRHDPRPRHSPPQRHHHAGQRNPRLPAPWRHRLLPRPRRPVPRHDREAEPEPRPRRRRRGHLGGALSRNQTHAGDHAEKNRQRLHAVAAAARALMDRHGLSDWTLAFSESRTQLGQCVYAQRLIRIALQHALDGTAQDIKDTVLHEIAHAIAGPDVGHGPAWKTIAARIGATPRASKHAPPDHAASRSTGQAM